MIFLEYVGSRACLSAEKSVNQAFARFILFFYIQKSTMGVSRDQRKNLRSYFGAVEI